MYVVTLMMSDIIADIHNTPIWNRSNNSGISQLSAIPALPVKVSAVGEVGCMLNQCILELKKYSKHHQFYHHQFIQYAQFTIQNSSASFLGCRQAFPSVMLETACLVVELLSYRSSNTKGSFLGSTY